MRRTNGRYGTKLALAATAMALVVPTQVGAAAQMDAGDDPQVTGALELETDECRRQQESYRGQIVASGKTCLRIYTFDPASETDEERNYGVVWLQSNLNSRRGWCGAEVLSDVDLPDDIAVQSRSPRSMELKRQKHYETALTAQAGGTATDSDSSIRQEQVLYPEEVRTRVLAKENIFRLKWVGLESEKLGFASGAEISWASDDSPGGISFRLNYQLTRGRC